MINALIIEDDRDIAELVEYHLRREGISCDVAVNGKAALAKANKATPTLIVLDLMLPDGNGLDICKSLRANPNTKGVPILMLTAKGSEIDRIIGFETGADDYMTKPFSPREFILRVKALLRRTGEKRPAEGESERETFGVLTVDAGKFSTHVEGDEVRLTNLEFKLLLYFLRHKGRVLTRENFLDRVWGYDAALTTRTVDTHIKRLREKLGRAGDYIGTVRGVGYRFREKI